MLQIIKRKKSHMDNSNPLKPGDNGSNDSSKRSGPGRSAESLFQEALRWHHCGQLDKAAVLYEQIRCFAPNHAGGVSHYGLLCWQQGNPDKAINLVTVAMELERHNPVHSYHLGIILSGMGRFAESIRWFQHSLKLKPGFGEAWFHMGQVFLKSGNPEQAKACYQKCLELKCQFPFVYHSMGLVEISMGHDVEAIPYFQQAVALNPKFAVAWSNLANILLRLNLLHRAKACLLRAIDADPFLADAWYHLGNVHLQLGSPSAAVDCYQKALAQNPSHANARHNLARLQADQTDSSPVKSRILSKSELKSLLTSAISFHQAGDLDQAANHYQTILESAPDHPDALHLMGVIFREKGACDKAIEWINKAIHIRPNQAIYFNNLGLAYKDIGLPDRALECFRQAVSLNPNLAVAWNNMCTVYRDQGHLEAAVTCGQTAIEKDSTYAPAYHNLASAFRALGQFNQAVDLFQKAIQIQPDFAEAYLGLGNLFNITGHPNEAIACYRKALAINADLAEVWCYLFHILQHQCQWDELPQISDKLDSFLARDLESGHMTAEPPFIHLSRKIQAEENLAVATSWSRSIARTMAPHRKTISREKYLDKQDRPLIIGYLSSDFKDHPVGHVLADFFHFHNRESVIIHGYSLGRDDGSRYRRKIANACDKFVDLAYLSPMEAAQIIFQNQVDILVDLMGYTTNGRLEICACRPAPIQVSWLGYPGTTGADFMDYLIADPIVIPREQISHYSEMPAYMPHCFFPGPASWPDIQRINRIEAGLPDHGIVFCSFNHAYKLEPIMFSTWMRILDRVPKSVLWLSGKNQEMIHRLRMDANRHGIDPDRLIFADRVSDKHQHLARLTLADLALDTRIYNGHTTSIDALAMGVPVITLMGNHFASRVSASLLHAAGLSDLVVNSLEDYEHLAVELARNPDRRHRYHIRLTQDRNHLPLFDVSRFVRNLETLYRQMWQRFINGQAPAVIGP